MSSFADALAQPTARGVIEGVLNATVTKVTGRLTPAGCLGTNAAVVSSSECEPIRREPYAKGGEHAVTNGILLGQDLHTLLDLGYVTVTPQCQVEVSQSIKEEFDNGKEYYALHGAELAVPERGSFQPDPELLRWHNETVFLS